ncbi:pantothenate kinase, type III family protein [Paraburkholderia xenovorans LB400]|jgi:type III pantothenate kinase|uniref:Type III pantothenate kinase n=1 Tax=Paraburkholderia xenovorans (strain LB400) TaxID=266265 RepID=COAX_PARXL|nr:type III pantothenate kinase [Paraburkholderia xenovorans]Q146G6.1 RecName: Full=Type III pantothenate kinase; AltName: Full=PanK-III; AltName: Full=Pantothenic acid kinase [Paraburkholderia xenovorans LB400]ABE28773.1 Putative transcriptional acitvator, Baf [Paraburkholderia xenovorans LB400]AIP30148.1 pantothenate kinase, type III family protein [Paraburkholderia xenovorans LB400]
MTSGAPCLLIDAGNSRIKWALVQAGGSQIASGALTHGGEHQPDWLSLPTPGGAWLSNVAGESVARRIAALLEARWPQLPLTTISACAQQCGVTNSYTAPHMLGSDRWAGLIGAHAAFPGEHLLIATFGTATTLEALRADGCFVGGLIAPGWTLMMRSLGEHTAQLPTLDASAARGLLDGSTRDAARRGPFFATDTPRSLSAGCTLAQAGLVERMWRDLQDEWQVPVRLVVSGGAVDEVASALKVPHTRHDSLVLSGLALIAAGRAAERGA